MHIEEREGGKGVHVRKKSLRGTEEERVRSCGAAVCLPVERDATRGRKRETKREKERKKERQREERENCSTLPRSLVFVPPFLFFLFLTVL